MGSRRKGQGRVGTRTRGEPQTWKKWGPRCAGPRRVGTPKGETRVGVLKGAGPNVRDLSPAQNSILFSPLWGSSGGMLVVVLALLKRKRLKHARFWVLWAILCEIQQPGKNRRQATKEFEAAEEDLNDSLGRLGQLVKHTALATHSAVVWRPGSCVERSLLPKGTDWYNWGVSEQRVQSENDSVDQRRRGEWTNCAYEHWPRRLGLFAWGYCTDLTVSASRSTCEHEWKSRLPLLIYLLALGHHPPTSPPRQCLCFSFFSLFFFFSGAKCVAISRVSFFRKDNFSNTLVEGHGDGREVHLWAHIFCSGVVQVFERRPPRAGDVERRKPGPTAKWGFRFQVLGFGVFGFGIFKFWWLWWFYCCSRFERFERFEGSEGVWFSKCVRGFLNVFWCCCESVLKDW